jgi:hypothetical protein
VIVRVTGNERMKTVATYIFVATLVLGAPGQTRQVRRPSLADDVLERQMQGSDLEYFTTTDAFYSSLGRTRSAGGMVRFVNCEDDKFKRPWKPSGSPLRQLLDAIVAADPRYQWQTQDAVINFLPVAGEPALLRIRISEFHAKRVTSAREALRRLLVLPEVRTMRSTVQSHYFAERIFPGLSRQRNTNRLANAHVILHFLIRLA